MSESHPPIMSGDTCQWCGASIMFVLTANNQRIPVDATPTPAGMLEVVDTATGGVPIVAATPMPFLGGPVVPADRYVPHGGTCTDPRGQVDVGAMSL